MGPNGLVPFRSFKIKDAGSLLLVPIFDGDINDVL